MALTGPAVDQAMKVAEVAAFLGVSVSTVKRSIPASELPFFTTEGGHRRYRRADVEAYVDRRRVSS